MTETISSAESMEALDPADTTDAQTYSPWHTADDTQPTGTSHDTQQQDAPFFNFKLWMKRDFGSGPEQGYICRRSAVNESIDGDFKKLRMNSLKAEWLFSQGRGRSFRPGQSAELNQYLAKICPLTSQSALEEPSVDSHLSRVLELQRRYQTQSPPDRPQTTPKQASKPVQQRPTTTGTTQQSGRGEYPPLQIPASLYTSTESGTVTEPNAGDMQLQDVSEDAAHDQSSIANQSSVGNQSAHSLPVNQSVVLTSSGRLESDTMYLPVNDTERPQTAPAPPPEPQEQVDHVSQSLCEREHGWREPSSVTRRSPFGGYENINPYEAYDNRPIRPMKQTTDSGGDTSPRTRSTTKPPAKQAVTKRVEKPKAVLLKPRKAPSGLVKPQLKLPTQTTKRSKPSTAAAATAIPLKPKIHNHSSQPTSNQTSSSQPSNVQSSAPPSASSSSQLPGARQSQTSSGSGKEYSPDKYSPHRGSRRRERTDVARSNSYRTQRPRVAEEAALKRRSLAEDPRVDSPTCDPDSSSLATLPQTMTNSAATRLQAAWKGWYTRNRNYRVIEIKNVLARRRMQDHITCLADELARVRSEADEERRRSRDQLKQNKQLHKEVQELKLLHQAGTTESVSVSTSYTTPQPTEVQVLKTQVNSLQEQIKNLQSELSRVQSLSLNVPRGVAVPLAPPHSLMVKGLSGCSVQLKWKPPDVSNKQLTGFNVYVDGKLWETVDSSRSQKAVCGLALGKTFNFTVRSLYDGGSESCDSGGVAVTLPRRRRKASDSSDAELNEASPGSKASSLPASPSSHRRRRVSGDSVGIRPPVMGELPRPPSVNVQRSQSMRVRRRPVTSDPEEQPELNRTYTRVPLQQARTGKDDGGHVTEKSQSASCSPQSSRQRHKRSHSADFNPSMIAQSSQQSSNQLSADQASSQQLTNQQTEEECSKETKMKKLVTAPDVPKSREDIRAKLQHNSNNAAVLGTDSRPLPDTRLATEGSDGSSPSSTGSGLDAAIEAAAEERSTRRPRTTVRQRLERMRESRAGGGDADETSAGAGTLVDSVELWADVEAAAPGSPLPKQSSRMTPVKALRIEGLEPEPEEPGAVPIPGRGQRAQSDPGQRMSGSAKSVSSVLSSSPQGQYPLPLESGQPRLAWSRSRSPSPQRADALLRTNLQFLQSADLGDSTQFPVDKSNQATSERTTQ